MPYRNAVLVAADTELSLRVLLGFYALATMHRGSRSSHGTYRPVHSVGVVRSLAASQ